MSVYITGDIHGDPSRVSKKNLKKLGLEIESNDTVIVCGDFGLPWAINTDGEYSKEDCYWIKWLKSRPFTTVFCDGNHENHDFLETLPTKKWHGGTVGVIAENIFHLKRGEIFTIEGKTYFAFGGGESIDKHLRRQGVSWWPQEIPSKEEFMQAAENLLQMDNKVDYVISHVPPLHIPGYDVPHDPVTNMLQVLYDEITATQWFFGHLHMDRFYYEQKMRAMYKAIVKIG